MSLLQTFEQLEALAPKLRQNHRGRLPRLQGYLEKLLEQLQSSCDPIELRLVPAELAAVLAEFDDARPIVRQLKTLELPPDARLDNGPVDTSDLPQNQLIFDAVKRTVRALGVEDPNQDEQQPPDAGTSPQTAETT